MMRVEPHLPLEELKRLERVEKDANRSRRLRIVILGIEGGTAPAIAMGVGLSRRICQRWVARHNEQGLAGLDDQRGQKSELPLSEQQQAAVRERVDAGPTAEDGVCSLRGKDVQRILAEEFGLLRSLSSVYWLLHRLGSSDLRPRPRHRKNDPAAMDAFKREWPDRIRDIAAVHPGQRLRVDFQDESRFGQQGTATNVWAQRGSRPTAVLQTEYQYRWVIGAVCPETGHAEGLLSPQLNPAIISTFLEQFSATIPDSEQAVMLWDGAGFHTAKALRVPANVTLVQRPPYSPELNPIENLWHDLKSHFWSNRTYADYEALEAAAMTTWQTVVLNEDLMMTVCAASYIESATSDGNAYYSSVASTKGLKFGKRKGVTPVSLDRIQDRSRDRVSQGGHHFFAAVAT